MTDSSKKQPPVIAKAAYNEHSGLSSPAAKAQPLPEDMLAFTSPVYAAQNRRGPLSSRILLWGTALTFAILFIWAAVADIEETITGMGQIIPSQRNQYIQNLEGGILEEVMVQEGAVVEEGDLLLRIFNEQASSTYRDALSRVNELEAAVARLEAELSGKEPDFPLTLLANHPEVVARHANLLSARRAQNAALASTLQRQLEVSKLEEQELVTKQRNLRATLELSTRQRDLAKELFKTRSYSEMDLLNLEQQVRTIKAELEALDSSIPRTRASIRLAEERLRLHQAELETRIRGELNQASAELTSLREIVIAGADRVTRTEVRSPVRGIVKSINITTRGGVIMPGQTIMEVVPTDDTLMFEARVRPQDIAFLFVGQPAKVRLSSYDFAIYGAIDAELDHISADAIEGKQGEIYYQVRLRLTSTLENNGRVLPVLPGMMGTVDIITGKKTVLSYIVKPLMRAKQAALRER